MADLVVFTSAAEKAAAARLEAFVEEARQGPNPLGDIAFDDDVWDVTPSTRGSGLGRKRITFSTLETAKSRSPTLLPMPFRAFAKAYLIEQQKWAETQNQQQRLSALRALNSVLSQSGIQLFSLRGDHLDHAARLIAGRFRDEAAYRIGAHLEQLSTVMSRSRLIALPLQWRNPLPRPCGTVRVGPLHEATRAKRLPSGDALEAVTLAFRAAVHPSDRLVAAMAALLCSAPVRIGEVLRMRAVCEVEGRTEGGKAAFGLSWWTEKGVDPETRWVLPQMEITVRAALSSIKEITSEARKIAAWYERHPTKLYLPPRYQHLRKAKFIDLRDADELLGLVAEKWAHRKRVAIRNEAGRSAFRFEEFESAVLRDLPDGFPIIERATRLKASEALFVVPFNQFRTDRGTSLCMIEAVTQQQVRDGLGGRAAHGVPSVFSRLGLSNADGSPIKINTHAFRHYLNTLLQRGGADPLDIAKWSGRKSVAQNRAYDHVSADEMLEDVGEAFGGAPALNVRPPATKEEFAVLRNGAAHVTEFGYCLHDFALLPCLLHRDCLNCDEHACVKGDRAKEARLKAYLDQARDLLAQAELGTSAGYEGADRWRDHQRRSVERAEQILAILGDPTVPDGAVIRGQSPKLDEVGSEASLAQSALGVPW